MTELKAKIANLPLSPGVYLFKNRAGQIIYIGKAVKLRRRVRQYFAKKQLNPKTRALVAEIADLDFITTESELDALFLEAELVKRHQPNYNILLRDDKSSVYIKITNYKPVPDITLVRLPNDDQALYFGPYFNAYLIRQALRFLRKIFPYFSKTYDIKLGSRLDQQIGLEPDVSSSAGREKYAQDLRQIIRFLKGDRLKIMAEIERKMLDCARRQDFEMAAFYRNQVFQLRALRQKVKIEQFFASDDRHDISLEQLTQAFGLKNPPERIEGFDVSHLGGTNVVASQVVFIGGVPSRAHYRHYKMKFNQNNDYANMGEVIRRRFAPKNLAKFGHPDLVLIDGGKGQLQVALAELTKLNQTTVPVLALAEKFEEIVIAKHGSNLNLSPEYERYLSENSADFWVLRLGKNQPVLQLLQRVRNEAHRFAISYQTKLTRQGRLHSQIDDLVGIGPKTRAKLQKKFSTSETLKNATLEEVAAVVGPAKAKIICQFFAKQD